MMPILSHFKYLHITRCILNPCKFAKNVGGKVFFREVSTFKETFKFSELQITLAEPDQRRPKPDPSKLVFGHEFCDHMFEVEWNFDNGWGTPRICPLHNLILHPASKVLHYAQELFEGMKAFHSQCDKVLLFRPRLNIERMLRSAQRSALPLFDREEFLMCLKKLVSIDRNWVPNTHLSALYIRPTMIGIEASLGVAASRKALLYVITGPVGPYFSTGVREPVDLFASPDYVRAWPGGVGDNKIGSNYGPTIYVQQQAAQKNLHQVLWLYGDDHQITEVGTMNIFVFLINENGEKELVTPPLNGIILPGIVRHSLLELAREWNEFKVSERIITMSELICAVNENRLLEMFGAGTACTVCPVKSISYLDKEISIPTKSSQPLVNQRMFDALCNIQYGRMPSIWAEAVD